LTHFGKGEPVPQGITITALFKEGQISGSSGCNRYFGGIAGDGPRDLRLGPRFGATMMACQKEMMSAEKRYLHLLEQVRAFGFVLGQLALRYEDKDEGDALLFAPSH
jgi:heat shock protein HslJ